MHSSETAAVRILRAGTELVQRVQALGRRAYVYGPAEQSVQLVPVGRRVDGVRIEPAVLLHQFHELRPPVTRAHRVQQIAPNRVLPYDDGQFDLLQAVRSAAAGRPLRVRAGRRGRRVRQALHEQELFDVGPAAVVVPVAGRGAVAAAAGPIPKAVPPVLERRRRRLLRRRRAAAARCPGAATVPVVHVQADGPVQRRGRRRGRHFQVMIVVVLSGGRRGHLAVAQARGVRVTTVAVLGRTAAA